MDGPGHCSAAPRSLLAHDSNVQIRALAVPALLAVRADRPVSDRAAAGRFLLLWHTGILGPMTSQAVETHTCACGCGTPITPGAKWARGHFHRGEGTWEPVPGPEDAPDLAAMMPDELGPVYGSTSVHDRRGDEDQADELAPDPEPADLRGERPRAAGRTGPPKVTAALRRDIEAKVSLPLEIAAQAWKSRDPICGGRAVEQRPATAHALTSIILQSADLIDFFTGPAGGFMVYLELGAALWPILELVLAHHIFGHGHGQADELGRPAAGPDLSRYAA